MEPNDPLALTRRHFLSNAALGLGALGLDAILGPSAAAGPNAESRTPNAGVHFPPKPGIGDAW